MTTSAPTQGRAFVLIGLVWLAIAVAVGASGRVAALRPPAPQVVLFTLTALVLVAAAAIPAFRTWLAMLDLRAFVALHLTRFVGIYFLVLHAQGQLPWAFAVPGGLGDIAVASLALGLLLFVPRLEERPGLVLTWNLLGLIDILFVVMTAGRLAAANPASMVALLHLPLSLLPTFLVPLIIASHALLFWRLRRLRAVGQVAV